MPAVRFIDDGVIMPKSERWLLNFEAVNLSKVDVIIHKIFAGNIQQFLQINNLDSIATFNISDEPWLIVAAIISKSIW